MSTPVARKPRPREDQSQEESPPSRRLRRTVGNGQVVAAKKAEPRAAAVAPPGLRGPGTSPGEHRVPGALALAVVAEVAEVDRAALPPPLAGDGDDDGSRADHVEGDEGGRVGMGSAPALLPPAHVHASSLARDDPTRETSPTSDVEMAHIEWALSAQSAQTRWAEAARTRRERTERLLRLPLADARTLLDAVVAATVASSGLEMAEEDGASAKTLFAWALQAHAQIAGRATTRAACASSRRGARLTSKMVRSLWAASEKINCLLDTVDEA